MCDFVKRGKKNFEFFFFEFSSRRNLLSKPCNLGTKNWIIVRHFRRRMIRWIPNSDALRMRLFLNYLLNPDFVRETFDLFLKHRSIMKINNLNELLLLAQMARNSNLAWILEYPLRPRNDVSVLEIRSIDATLGMLPSVRSRWYRKLEWWP